MTDEYLDHREMDHWIEALEEENDKTLRADQPIICHLGGACFRQFTSRLEKPFDLKFHEAMVDTARRLAHQFGANFVMAASDKITMIRYHTTERSSIWCGQSMNRILATTASTASLLLSKACADLDVDTSWIGTFAGHAFNAPTKAAAVQALACFEQKHHRKALSTMVHVFLGKQKESLSTGRLKQLLQDAGHSWESMPSAYKHGSAFKRVRAVDPAMRFELKTLPGPLFFRDNLVEEIFSTVDEEAF